MSKKKAAWKDLRHEILGLKGAILGAKSGLFHGGEVTEEMLETFQELAKRIYIIAERLENANYKDICKLNDNCVTMRRELQAQSHYVKQLDTGDKR